MRTLNLLIISGLFLIGSCSNKGTSSKLESTDGMTAGQIKAREVVTEDMKHLQTPQYGISDDDVALLKTEGLLSEDELNSLKIVR